ncbi:MAG: YidB family protein [Polaromonas sp.]
MGLLDSVLGAVMNQQGGQSAGHTGAAGMGGLGGLIGLVAGNPQLLQIVTGMLSNGGAEGGLGGLIGKFQQAGLGDAMSSWIGGGPNQHVSPDQMTSALGEGTISQIAAQLGLSQGEAAGQLSQLLPEVINHLTPTGQAPEGGLGNSGDLMGMLGGLLQAR